MDSARSSLLWTFEKSSDSRRAIIKIWYYVKGKKGRGGSSKCCQIGVKGVP